MFFLFKRLRRSRPRIFVLFAREDDTYSEEFVGIALTREQETAMGKLVDSAEGVTCWTEEVELQGWQGVLDEAHYPATVFLVFRGGEAQDSIPSDGGDEPLDPEILGAFVDRALAQDFIATRSVLDRVDDYHVWELAFGWMPKHMLPAEPRIALYENIIRDFD